MTIRDLPKIIPPMGVGEEKYTDMYMKNGTGTKVPRVNVTYSRKRLYLAALAGNLLYLSTGCIMAWPSPTLPKMMDSGLSEDNASWIGSLYALGAAFGPALTALCLDTVGRKACLLIIASIFLISWIIIGCTTSLPVLFIGRIVGGIGVGGSFACVPVYLAEISDNEVRGAIGSVNQMFVGIGLMLEYAIGPYVSYSSLVGVSSAAAVLFILCILAVPESPYYLMAKGRRDKAVSALCWLRGNVRPPLVQRELAAIEETLSESKRSSGKINDLFLKRGPRRAFLVCLWTMFCQQISGVNVVLSFAQSIFQMASKTFSPQISSMMIGGVNIVASAFAPPLVKLFGLKPVLIGTSYGMAVCQLAMSLYFYLSMHENVTSIGWLPITSPVLFCAFFCIGAGPLPWTSVAELFPSELKGFAACLIGAYAWIISFLVMKTYDNILKAFGPMSVFLFFGLAELLGVTIMCFIQPNTKNLSFQEIQDLLSGTPAPVNSDDDKDSID